MIRALATRFPHADFFRNQLREILVRSDHEALETVLFRAPDESADDVVRLVAVELQNGDVKGAAKRFHMGNGRSKLFRHLITLRFVSGKTQVPWRRGRGVEGNSDVCWTLFFQNRQQSVDEAIQR